MEIDGDDNIGNMTKKETNFKRRVTWVIDEPSKINRNDDEMDVFDDLVRIFSFFKPHIPNYTSVLHSPLFFLICVKAYIMYQSY